MPCIDGGTPRYSRSSFFDSPSKTSRSGEANALRRAKSRT